MCVSVQIECVTDIYMKLKLESIYFFNNKAMSEFSPTITIMLGAVDGCGRLSQFHTKLLN